MRVEAVYDRGRLEFIRPVRLRRESLRLIVEIPDEEVAPTSQAAGDRPSAGNTRERLNAILGHWRRQGVGADIDSKAIWHAHVEDKHLEER